jgi:hypothetical protein
VTLTRDPAEAVEGADVVTTDVWASMGQEEEAAGASAAFEGFMVDDALMARPPEAIFLHCLPAHRGEEVSAERDRRAAVADLRRGREPAAHTESHSVGADGVTDDLKRTPLHEEHVRLGGSSCRSPASRCPSSTRRGSPPSTVAVRESAGLFDVSHMGEFIVTGPDALALIQHVSVNDASRIEVGQAQYSAMCFESGCVVDDLIVYRFADRYMLVVNAANLDKDLAWIRARRRTRRRGPWTSRTRRRSWRSRGRPRARSCDRSVDLDLDDIRYYRFAEGSVAGVRR